MFYTSNNFKNMIRYEDKDLLVVFKPAGLAVESRRVSQQDLEGLAKLWRMERGERAEIYPVQRLDQPVEGLMVLAKTKKAASILSGELKKGQLKKIYRAKVAGTIPAEEGELVNILIADKASNGTLVLDENSPTDKADPSDCAGSIRYNKRSSSLKSAGEKQRGRKSGAGRKSSASGKRAVLNYRKIAGDEVEIDLKTGRHHQIRAQLSHAGMPIVGDVKYGGPAAEQLCLSSCRLTLIHPSTRKTLTWEAIPTWEQTPVSP